MNERASETTTGRAFNPDALRVVMGRRRTTAPMLAVKIGKRSSEVKRWIVGIDEPTDQELQQIARLFEWPVAFFYNTKVEWPSPEAFS